MKLLIIFAGEIDIVNIQNANGETALHLLAHNNRPEIIRYLLLLNANVGLQDYEGNTALHIAVKQKHIDVLRIILQKGSDHAKYIDKKNNGKFYGIMLAFAECHFTAN